MEFDSFPHTQQALVIHPRFDLEHFPLVVFQKNQDHGCNVQVKGLTNQHSGEAKGVETQYEIVGSLNRVMGKATEFNMVAVDKGTRKYKVMKITIE